MHQLSLDLALLLDNWLGLDREERLRRIHSIARVGEKGMPLVVLQTEDQLIYLEIKRMHASFLPDVEWFEYPGDLGIPKPDDDAH